MTDYSGGQADQSRGWVKMQLPEPHLEDSPLSPLGGAQGASVFVTTAGHGTCGEVATAAWDPAHLKGFHFWVRRDGSVVRAPDTLAKDQGSILNIHMTVYNHL